MRQLSEVVDPVVVSVDILTGDREQHAGSFFCLFSQLKDIITSSYFIGKSQKFTAIRSCYLPTIFFLNLKIYYFYYKSHNKYKLVFQDG